MTREYIGNGGTIFLETGAREFIASSGTIVNEASSAGTVGATINLAGSNVSQSAASATAAVTVDAPVAGTVNLAGSNTSQSAASGTAVATITGATGTLTTRVFKNDTRTVMANLANSTINIYNATTGALVLRQTGLTTTAAGRLVVTNAALVSGTTYAYEADFSASSNGRRLPTAAAA